MLITCCFCRAHTLDAINPTKQKELGEQGTSVMSMYLSESTQQNKNTGLAKEVEELGKLLFSNQSAPLLVQK